MNCKCYFWFNGSPWWNSHQEQLGSHWSPLNIKETSKPGNPLAVNDLKPRKGVVSRGVVGCLWNFLLPKQQLQVTLWIECQEENLSANMRLVLPPQAFKKFAVKVYKLLIHRGYCVLPLLWQGCWQCLLTSSPHSVLLLNHPSSFVTSQCLDQI